MEIQGSKLSYKIPLLWTYSVINYQGSLHWIVNCYRIIDPKDVQALILGVYEHVIFYRKITLQIKLGYRFYNREIILY